MEKLETIVSASNNKLKLAGKLHTAKYRRESQMFIAEGLRLSEMAVNAQWPVEFALVNESALNNQRVVQLIERLQEQQVQVSQVSDDMYKKATDTVNPQGIMLVLKQKIYTWQEVLHCPRGNAPLVAVLDGIQDPGNAGTIIRTADALGCTGIVCLEGTTDLYADKTVRATMGSLFNMPILHHISPDELLDTCRENDVFVLAAALDESAIRHYAADYNSATAVILGNEGNGVSEKLLESANQRIFIPMTGQAESLNVAAAAAIILYEASRQRTIF